MKYHVKRRHIGDRMYEEGDVREATEADVAHLVRNGVLVAAGEKTAAALQNKAAPPNENKKLDRLTIDQLKAFALDKKIDLGDAVKKADIVAAIELATEVAAQ